MNTQELQKILDLSGKTALITGGARGIGYGIAKRLADAGANLVIADLSEQNAAGAAKKLSSGATKAIGLKIDVTSEVDVAAGIQKAINQFGAIDILVNNAGIFPSMTVLNMSSADFDHVIDTNLKGVFLCTKLVAKQMITQGKGGKIINVTSIDALHPSSVGLAHYDASKHGVWGFTKNIALELAPHKIWVNAIAPGGIATEGVADMQKGMVIPQGVDIQKMMEGFMAKIPMKRMGEPDDIGKVALFLASDMSSYMTGTQIVVDGGVLLG